MTKSPTWFDVCLIEFKMNWKILSDFLACWENLNFLHVMMNRDFFGIVASSMFIFIMNLNISKSKMKLILHIILSKRAAAAMPWVLRCQHVNLLLNKTWRLSWPFAQSTMERNSFPSSILLALYSVELIFCTAKRLSDKSIISPINPKFENQFFDDPRVLFDQFCKSNQKQFVVCNLFKTCKSTKIMSSCFGLIEGVTYGPVSCSFSCNFFVKTLVHRD